MTPRHEGDGRYAARESSGVVRGAGGGTCGDEEHSGGATLDLVTLHRACGANAAALSAVEAVLRTVGRG